MTDYARKMALDMRMIDPNYEDHPDNKASHCAKMIAEYTKNTTRKRERSSFSRTWGHISRAMGGTSIRKSSAS